MACSGSPRRAAHIASIGKSQPQVWSYCQPRTPGAPSPHGRHVHAVAGQPAIDAGQGRDAQSSTLSTCPECLHTGHSTIFDRQGRQPCSDLVPFRVARQSEPFAPGLRDTQAKAPVGKFKGRVLGHLRVGVFRHDDTSAAPGRNASSSRPRTHRRPGNPRWQRRLRATFPTSRGSGGRGNPVRRRTADAAAARSAGHGSGAATRARRADVILGQRAP